MIKWTRNINAYVECLVNAVAVAHDNRVFVIAYLPLQTIIYRHLPERCKTF